MKNMSILLPLLFVLPFSHCQKGMCQADSAHHKPVKKIARVTTMQNLTEQGWLLKAGDDSVHLLWATSAFGMMAYKAPDQNNRQWAISVTDIKTIKTRTNRPVLKGLLIGLVSGVAIGAIAGYAGGDDELIPYSNSNNLFDAIDVAVANSFAMTAEEKAAMGAVGGGLLGAMAGSIVGAVAKTKISIGGNRQAYKEAQETLRKKAMLR